MNILITMAGEGSRFKNAGYKTPKPLIEVGNEYMFMWALKSLPLDLCENLILICRKDHIENTDLKDHIHKNYSDCNPHILEIDELTEGQACTALLAKKMINNSNGLIIHNSDTYFESKLKETLFHLDKEVDGLISVFEDTDSKWSFARLGENGYVDLVAEKNPISSFATTGMYHFRRGSDFVSAAEEMIAKKDRINNEYYVGPVYNYLIKKGKRIVIDKVDSIWGLGTPVDLDIFIRDFLK